MLPVSVPAKVSVRVPRAGGSGVILLIRVGRVVRFTADADLLSGDTGVSVLGDMGRVSELPGRSRRSWSVRQGLGDAPEAAGKVAFLEGMDLVEGPAVGEGVD